MPELLAALSGAATTAEVNLEGISFTTVESRFTDQSGAAARRSLGTQVSAVPRQFHLAISGSANYLAAKAFLKALEEEQRLIDISDISFRPSGVRESSQSSTATSSAALGGAFKFQIDAVVHYIEKPTFTLP